MPMNYTQIYDLGARQSLMKKTAAAITMAATYVIAGGGGATATQKNNARVALNNPWQEAGRFIWYVVNDTNVQNDELAAQDSATDLHVRAVVDANWPILWA